MLFTSQTDDSTAEDQDEDTNWQPREDLPPLVDTKTGEEDDLVTSTLTRF